MITLDELMPNSEERQAISAIKPSMPDQVACGFLRARRKDQTRKRFNLHNDSGPGYGPGLGDLFDGIFKSPGS